MKGSTCTKLVKLGVPQGGVLSSDAWNLTDQTLLDLINNDDTGVRANGFADDTVLLVWGKNLKKTT